MRGRSDDAAKRVVDVLVASSLLVLTAPIQALVALLVRRRLGSPVLFRQPRPGKDGKVFELVKFRSMVGSRTRAARWSPTRERLTPFGAWLRSTSLDELPTLWNVLRG